MCVCVFLCFVCVCMGGHDLGTFYNIRKSIRITPRSDLGPLSLLGLLIGLWMRGILQEHKRLTDSSSTKPHQHGRQLKQQETWSLLHLQEAANHVGDHLFQAGHLSASFRYLGRFESICLGRSQGFYMLEAGSEPLPFQRLPEAIESCTSWA